MPSILWIAPETKGGIRSYVEGLLPSFRGTVKAEFTVPAAETLADSTAEVIHVQHEYGLFGSKIPGRYTFPGWFRKARAATPGKKWVVTAHSVLDPDYRFPYEETGWQRIPRFFLNVFLALPFNALRKLWGERTWGGFDGAIVLHRQQLEPVRAAGCPWVAVIPLPVAEVRPLPEDSPNRHTKVTLFGFFAAGKGQDIAIRAWKILGPGAPKLVLAGGVRRREDRPYYDSCVKLIASLGLQEKVEITGYVPDDNLPRIYHETKLVLAPFRASTGSASIATAFSYGAAVLASDLVLNRELDFRVPGCLEFFETESSESLANVVRTLLGDEERLASLRVAGRTYAEKYSTESIVEMHLDFYRKITDGRTA